MNAMFSLPLADLPGTPMANRGKAVLAAIPVTAVRKARRLIVGVVRRDGIWFLVMVGLWLLGVCVGSEKLRVVLPDK